MPRFGGAFSRRASDAQHLSTTRPSSGYFTEKAPGRRVAHS